MALRKSQLNHLATNIHQLSMYLASNTSEKQKHSEQLFAIVGLLDGAVEGLKQVAKETR